MEISVVFEFDSTNSSSADTSLDTFRFYQKFQLKQLATWQFKEVLKETEEENIWMTVEKMGKEKESSKERGRNINYADRRSMLQKSLRL